MKTLEESELANLKSSIVNIIENTKSVDYLWDGEDEVMFEETDSDECANKIIKLVKDALKNG